MALVKHSRIPVRNCLVSSYEFSVWKLKFQTGQKKLVRDGRKKIPKFVRNFLTMWDELSDRKHKFTGE